MLDRGQPDFGDLRPNPGPACPAMAGGPSLIGAWAVHFFGALGMSVVAMWLLRPLTRWQVRDL